MVDYMAQKYKLYSRPAYFREIEGRIARAGLGDQIFIASMRLGANTPEIAAILDQLAKAAKRGAKVKLAIDAHAFLLSDISIPGPLVYRTKIPRHPLFSFGASWTALDKIKKSGGTFKIINLPNRPLTNPVAGRCHIKLAVINDRIYLGGCNLDNNEWLDIMVSLQDQRAADWLMEIYTKIFRMKNTVIALSGEDVVYSLGSDAEIILDCGKNNQSLIYQKTLELIDRAEKSVFITCQYFPYGLTAKHLLAAHKRGVKITIIYNHPAKHGTFAKFLQRGVILKEQAKMPSEFFEHQLPRTMPFLHAKLIASEIAVIVGSHNFVEAGVNFGTAEIALQCKNPDFAGQAVKALKDQLK